jgi:hypothetical protein
VPPAIALSSQNMTSPIAPDTAARDAATAAGAHLAATTLFCFLAFLATPAAARDRQDDSPIGQSAGASQSVAATVTCSSKPGERSSRVARRLQQLDVLAQRNGVRVAEGVDVRLVQISLVQIPRVTEEPEIFVSGPTAGPVTAVTTYGDLRAWAYGGRQV